MSWSRIQACPVSGGSYSVSGPGSWSSKVGDGGAAEAEPDLAPALVEVAEQPVARHTELVEEDEVLAPVAQVVEGAQLDAGHVHRRHEVADAPVPLATRSGSVRAAMMIQLQWWPAVQKVFWPLITHSSPSGSARVRSEARSEPAFGSV